MTLAELGERSDLSISYLSQVERDKTTPSLSTLTAIARSLDVGLRYFFETDVEAAHVLRGMIEQAGPESGPLIMRQRLMPEVGSNKLEVYRVTLTPHALSEQLAQYTGEEFIFVLAGEVAITVGDEQFVLTSGDSVHYDAIQPHTWSNNSDEPCVLIWSRSIS